MSPAEIDTAAVRELDLYAENTSELYRQFQSIIANLSKRIAKGTYDASKAPTLWRYWYDAAARHYCKEFACSMAVFPPAVRQACAEQRAQDEYVKITNGEYRPAEAQSPQVRRCSLCGGEDGEHNDDMHAQEGVW